MLFLFKNISFSDDLMRGFKALEDKDYSKALYFLSYYAENGNPKAQYNLGLMYKKGKGLEIDHKEANKWFFLSASQGNMLAQYAIGLNYYTGIGIELDYNKAMDFFKMAAFQGHPSSQINIGNMYFIGQGTKKNFPRAHMWWKLAEDKNILGARKNILRIEKIMNENQKQKAKKLYESCLKTTLPKC